MAKATQEDFAKAIDACLHPLSDADLVKKLNRAVKVAKRLPKPPAKPTPLNRAAGRKNREQRNKQRGFKPRTELYNQHALVLDDDGNELCQGWLTEIRSMSEYQIKKPDGNFEVFFIDQTDQFEWSEHSGVTLYGAHSLGDLP